MFLLKQWLIKQKNNHHLIVSARCQSKSIVMKKWIIIGVLIRLPIIPLTYHSDPYFFIFSNFLLTSKQLWFSIYDFLGSSPEPLAQVLPPYAFTYPPLAILIGGIYSNLLYRLSDLNFIRDFILNPDQNLNHLQFYWLLFLTKLPYLIPDLLTGYFLAQIVPSKHKIKTFIFWMLNPITLYATFAIGQFDIYPVLATVLAVYFFKQQKTYHAVISLGIGGAFKLFPLLFLPLIILKSGKNLRHKTLLALTGFLAYFIPILPYLNSPGFRTYALLAPQTDKMLFAKIPITGAEYLSYFIVGYLFIVIFSYFNKINFWKSITIVLLLFFSLTHFHPQWFIWLSPWLIILFINYPFTQSLITGMILCYTLIVFSFESSLNWGIFIWNQNAPPLINFLPHFIQTENYKYLSIIRSIFAGINYYLIFILGKSKSIIRETS